MSQAPPTQQPLQHGFQTSGRIFQSVIRNNTLPTTINATTAAAIASALSIGLSALAAAAGAAVTGLGCATGAGVARVAVVAEAVAGAGAAAGAPAATAPPGGMLGNLIVGAADGLGGKLIRTVSFLGCTLPVSFFGGTAPGGTLGMFSAIATHKLCTGQSGVKF